jgi:hypothetical protein
LWLRKRGVCKSAVASMLLRIYVCMKWKDVVLLFFCFFNA